MIKFKIPEKLAMKDSYVWLSSWFGCGFISPAPGTWGSLGALPFGVMIYALGGGYTLCACAAIITIIGLWSATKFDAALESHDSKMIVIDEVAGQWIALIPAALNPVLIMLAFILFRFFDILKPWPVSFFDKKVDGAAGVMFDDVVAGIYAAGFVMVISNIL